MELLDLIFALVQQYVPIPEKNYRSLYAEATTWRNLLEDPDKKDEDYNVLELMYKKVHRPWIVRLAIACAYIPVFRWLNAPSKPENENEED